MSKEVERPTVEESSEEESSDDSEHDTPSGEDESIPEVVTQLRGLNLDMSGKNPTPSGSQVGGPRGSNTGEGGSGPKVNAPQEFTGARNQFEAFQMQCLIVFKMTDKYDTADKKVMFITSYLRGGAYDWIQPHLRDYLTNDQADRKPATNRMFAGANALFREMEATFKHGSEELEAERDVQRIYQKGSAARYKAEFQILAAKTSWNDEALAAQFYRGLKDVVKDEIARGDRPSTTDAMYALAIKIDERLYERLLEKKGKFVPRGANTKAKRDLPEWRNDYYGPQKMQLDATQGKPGSKGQKKGQKKSKDKSQVECYGCGKKGHYKNECKARKQSHELQKSGKQEAFRATKGKGSEEESPKPATIAATNHWTYEDVSEVRGAYDTTGTNTTISQDNHGSTSWTACCDDSCAIHMSDKMGSGYFPSHRRQSICLTRGMPDSTRVAREALVRYPTPDIEELSLEGSTPEESEQGDAGEDSDESELSETEQIHANFRVGDVVPTILGRIMLRKDEVFPWINGIQRVHDADFTRLIWDVRQLLRNTPLVEDSIDYRMIVQEWPPVGSDFTARGGYVTPNQICIPRNMRERVRTLKRDYEMEAERQVHEQANRVRPLLPRVPRDEEVPTEERMGDDARDTTECTTAWEPPLSISDPRYVPHSRHSRLGASSDVQRASSGRNRTNQGSGN